MAEIIALVAVEAAFASAERMRKRSRPLPLHACAYERVVIFRSVASINSGAIIYLLASSAVRGGKPEVETVLPAVAGAAVLAAVCVDADWACDCVWRAVAWRF
eukprot:908445-Pleurochrysis_carterae.AAC.1